MNLALAMLLAGAAGGEDLVAWLPPSAAGRRSARPAAGAAMREVMLLDRHDDWPPGARFAHDAAPRCS